MTYLELAYESAHDLDRGKITLGEYEERIKPLCDEIKPWNGWIPTSERFPERFALVLFSVNFGLVEEGFYMGAKWKGLASNAIYRNDDITAWQSLPNPYHAESEDATE